LLQNGQSLRQRIPDALLENSTARFVSAISLANDAIPMVANARQFALSPFPLHPESVIPEQRIIA
jgi:hypothetical protein